MVPTDELKTRYRVAISLEFTVASSIGVTERVTHVGGRRALDGPPAQISIRRFLTVMKIHEYQAKAILARHGVRCRAAKSHSTQLKRGEIAKRLGGSVVVVKAQIHAGGRGKGGGVKLAKSPADAETLAKAMLGMTLITHQTGPEGRIVGRVLVEEGLQMTRELYLSLVLDRAAGKSVMMASAAGGMDIEEVAEKTPEKIFRVSIEPGRRHRAVRSASAGLRHWPRWSAGQQVREGCDVAVRRIRGDGRIAARD